MTDQRSGPGPGRQQRRRGAGILVGRIRGVPVYLSPLAVVFAIIFASLFAGVDRNRLPDLSSNRVYVLAAITAVGFLLSLVLHEVGHAIAALHYDGLTVRAVTIYGFAGFTEIEPEPQTPWREFVVSFAGPAVNGVLAALSFAGVAVTNASSQPGVLLFDLAWVNLILFVFNIAPGLPLDGGRLVVAAVWGITHNKTKGARFGAYGGFVIAAACGVWGLSTLNSGYGGLYTIMVAAFIGIGAYQSLRRTQLRERLPGLSAGRIARKTLPVEAAVPLAEALRRAQEVGATAVVVVHPDGTPFMIMNGAAVDALPDNRRPWVPVTSVARTISPDMILPAELEGEDLLVAVQANPATEYLVTQAGRPVGVMAMVDLVARIDPAGAARMVAKQ